MASLTAPYYLGDAAQTTLFKYDALDRVVEQWHSDGNRIQTAYGFSAAALGLDAVTVTDELGRPATLHRDVQGRLVRRDRLLAGVTVSTHSRWDVLGRLTGVTDHAGNVWSYSYDSLGRRTAVADPDLGSWTYAYDDAGRLTQQTDALAQVTRLTYDGLGRVLTKTARFGTPQAATTTYTFDQARAGYYNVGRQTTLANAAATIEQDWDAEGRLAAKRYLVDAVTRAFATDSPASADQAVPAAKAARLPRAFDPVPLPAPTKRRLFRSSLRTGLLHGEGSIPVPLPPPFTSAREFSASRGGCPRAQETRAVTGRNRTSEAAVQPQLGRKPFSPGPVSPNCPHLPIPMRMIFSWQIKVARTSGSGSVRLPDG